MALRPKLELRQTQQLTMTPQLRQAIQMLQMSTLDLSAYLTAEVERNPLLEIADGSEAAERPEPTVGELAAVDSEIRRGDLTAGDAQFAEGAENLYESGDGAAWRETGRGGRSDFESLDGDAAGRVAESVTLASHICAQLALARLTPVERLAGEALAAELDEAGYLRIDLGEAAARLGAPRAALERAAEAIRGCDPTGVGARSLAECLALQLAERDRLDPAMRTLLDNLEALPTTPAALMAARCGVGTEDFADMLAELRTLDPRPGFRLGGGLAPPAAPDVRVSPDGAGGWTVELNPETAPRLLIDRSYAARVHAEGRKETRLFLAECAQNASWLARTLDQRARTIVKVASEIVRLQIGFLERGVSGLRPMTLRDVAEAVGVHESTVSRVTANKFMATPRGLFEMKFFFSTALPSADGAGGVSAEAVRERIRALVAAEPPGQPLSDDRLVQILSAEGVEVARRTVAKYRESLRIPSSVERRRRAAAAV